MTASKRVMDICLALVFGAILFLPGLLIACCVLLLDGRPVFYRSERMKSFEQGFTLWKFRTMRDGSADDSVSGGYKCDRITSLGRFLRRMRLDEIPQIINILRGDMSFVGPRPPLRRYVDLRPEIYEKVLTSRPGITGFATVHFHRIEEQLLKHSHNKHDADAIYIHHCIPAKAQLDLYWAEHRSLWRDFGLLWLTVAHVCFEGTHKQTPAKSTQIIRTA